MATVETERPLTQDEVAPADRLPELAAAYIAYTNTMERLVARMRHSVEQGDRMLAELGLPRHR